MGGAQLRSVPVPARETAGLVMFGALSPADVRPNSSHAVTAALRVASLCKVLRVWRVLDEVRFMPSPLRLGSGEAGLSAKPQSSLKALPQPA